MEVITTGNLAGESTPYKIWEKDPFHEDTLTDFSSCIQHIEEPYLEAEVASFYMCRIRIIGYEKYIKNEFTYQTIVKRKGCSAYVLDNKSKQLVSVINQYCTDIDETILKKIEQEKFLRNYPEPQETMVNYLCLGHQTTNKALLNFLEHPKILEVHNDIEKMLSEIEGLIYKGHELHTSVEFIDDRYISERDDIGFPKCLYNVWYNDRGKKYLVYELVEKIAYDTYMQQARAHICSSYNNIKKVIHNLKESV